MPRLLYTLGLLLIGALFVAPLLFLLSQPEWNNYRIVFENENTLRAMANTVLVAGSVGLLCLLIGLPTAWVLTRTDLSHKQGWRRLLALPYAIPPYVGAIGWIILANPTSGVLNQWLGLNLNIYSVGGLIWVETSFLFTFVLLTALASLDKMDSSLEEAARLSGAPPWRVFKDIALPLLRPAMLNGFILSFLGTAASFGVPALIGGPARIYLLTTQIYTFQRMGTANGFRMAIATSVILMITSLVLLFGSQKFFSSKLILVGGKAARPSLVSTGRWKILLQLLLGLFFFVVFVLPVSGLLLSALSSTQGSWSFANLGLQNFVRVLFETEETLRALSQSFFLGLSAALICTAFSFVFVYFQVHSQWWGRHLSSTLASIPFSTPGVVLALALILTFSHGYFGMGPSLYNTLGLILLAYVIKYQSLSFKTVTDGYSQIHPSLAEAARISGASWWKTMTSIYAPLLKPVLLASCFLIFMPVVSELTMTILLTGPGLETIGTLIFSLQEYSDIGGGGSAVLSLMVIAMVLLLQLLLGRFFKGAQTG